MQAVVLALLALALSGILPALGPWLHSLGLFAGLTWLGWTLWQRRGAWRLPSRGEAARRLEQDSGVAHRPLQAIADRPLGDDPTGQALWQAHQRQLAAHLAQLRPAPPTNALPRLDRFAWRAGALLAVVIALFLAGHDWRHHLRESIQPRFAAIAGQDAPAVDLWIEPPAYTNKPPIFAPASGEPMRVPIGSMLVARVSRSGSATLEIDDQTHAFEEDGPDSHKLTMELTEGRQMAVRGGGSTLAEWPLDIVYDQPPTAEFVEPPSATPRQSLRIDYAFADDYGVTAARAEIRLAGQETAADAGEPLLLVFPLGDVAATVQSSSFHDLTPHPWAGRKVLVRLQAVDALGQTGESDSVIVTLPERVFTHPVAREIIAARKDLDQGQPPREVASALGKIAQFPGRFDDNTTVFLGLRASSYRLWRNTDEAALTSVRDLLWDIALRLDQGDLPGAERDLRAAQEALQEALARNADEAEIRRLVEELRQAMRRFASELANQGGQPPSPPAPAQANDTAEVADLERMLDQIQSLAESGSTQAARDLLAQLQQMLESAQASQQMSEAQQQQAAAMTQMLNQLMEMQRRQQALIDQTFERNQQAQPPQNGPPDANAGQPQIMMDLRRFGLPNLMMPQLRQPGQRPSQSREQRNDPMPGPMPGLAQDQDDLRRDLGELMRQLGEMMGNIPDAMQQAEQAMRSARDNLQQGAGNPALAAENVALEHLRQAGQGLSQQLSQQMGTQSGPGTTFMQGRGSAGPGQNRDPLGREGQDGQSASEVGPRLPTETETQRARRIRDTLYKRSADPDRPVPEQDYLRRLLRQF